MKRRINPNLIFQQMPTGARFISSTVLNDALVIQFRDEAIDNPGQWGFSRFQACRIYGEIDEWILPDALYALRDWLNANLPPYETLIIDPATRKEGSR